jgi:TIR domain
MTRLAHIRLDPLLPVSWSKAFGDRAFQYDAFISHNRDDRSSVELAAHLLGRGVTVWHDENQDIRGRKIQQKVAAALTRSRFVVVCISGDFRDAPWCRAEYLPALEVEERSRASRVTVAQMSPEASIPGPLSAKEPLSLLRRCCTHVPHD